VVLPECSDLSSFSAVESISFAVGPHKPAYLPPSYTFVSYYTY